MLIESKIALGAVAFLVAKYLAKPTDASATPTDVTGATAVPANSAGVRRVTGGGGTVAPNPVRAAYEPPGAGNNTPSRAMTPSEYAENVAFFNANVGRGISMIPGVGTLSQANRAVNFTRDIYTNFFSAAPLPSNPTMAFENSQIENTAVTMPDAIADQQVSITGGGYTPVTVDNIDAQVMAETAQVYGGGGNDSGGNAGGDGLGYGPQ